MTIAKDTPGQVDHVFRYEYGRLVAMLASRAGMRYIEDVEDAVQAALLAALEQWTISGVPENRTAWLFRVANNHLLATLRRRNRRLRILQENAAELHAEANDEPGAIGDSARTEQLWLLFVCCNETLPVESQVVFALKTLCGFDVREIAQRLFATEANIYKRLERARNRLKKCRLGIDELTEAQINSRLVAVRSVLYVLFTEGYLSSHADFAIRRELCDEAIRLCLLLAEHPACAVPETHALLALMYLHGSRMNGRCGPAGGLLLLEEQRREGWDRALAFEGFRWLEKSASGEEFSRYHAEAGVAAEHWLAPSFADTRWDRIVKNYEILEQSEVRKSEASHSARRTSGVTPVHRLNRALAMAEWQGPEKGLAVLEGFDPPSWLAKSYLWSATLADLHGRCGNRGLALEFQEAALHQAPNSSIREMLERRFANFPN